MRKPFPTGSRQGREPVQRSANVEAISHLTKGLELLKTLPDTPERAQQELALQTTLGPLLIATKGYAAEEREQPIPGRGNCVGRWGKLLSSSRCCSVCGRFILCGRSTRRRTHLENNSLAWPRASRHNSPHRGPLGAGSFFVRSRRGNLCPSTPGAEHCPLRPPRAPLPGFSLWIRPGDELPDYWGLGSVVTWLSRSGSDNEPEVDHSGPKVVSPL